mgnify:CR=1 FL=1
MTYGININLKWYRIFKVSIEEENNKQILSILLCGVLFLSLSACTKEKRKDKKLSYIAIPLLANFIGFIIVAIIVLANLTIPF